MNAPRPSVPSRFARTAVVVAAVAASSAGCPSGDAPASAPPNVLLLVMDTARADRCSFLGHTAPTTPRLAEFARDAVVYEDAWSPVAWTGPAHATLFSGVRPERHDFTTRSKLGKEFPTLAEKLSGLGYATASYSNNAFVSKSFDLLRGFQVDDPLFARRGAPYPSAPEGHRRASEWMAARHAEGRPFFCFVNDIEPHAPFNPPEKVAAPFLRPGLRPEIVEQARSMVYPATGWVSLSPKGPSPDLVAAFSGLYDGELAALDAAVGDLLDRMRAGGYLDRTLVVVTSDHGEGLGDHGWIEHAADMHREQLRVPLVVRLPGRFDGGRVVKDVVRLEDVPPTILDVCGGGAWPGIDGVPVTRDLAGRKAHAWDRPAFVLAEVLRRAYPESDVRRLLAGRRSVYDGRHHLIEATDGTVLLYDVPADPRETRNLAADLPDVVARLRAELTGREPR